MSQSDTLPNYEAVIVPALHRIQEEFGYLKREALIDFSNLSGIPLHRLHSVASFFPHFQLSPPKKITLRICRDMACGMAGANEMIKRLQRLVGDEIAVEGVSCVGRCDRAPAASVQMAGSGHEHYHVARTEDELAQIVSQYAAGQHPRGDHDADLPNPLVGAEVDPYQNGVARYEATRRVIAKRNASLQASARLLSDKYGFSPEQSAMFQFAAVRQLRGEGRISDDCRRAVRNWQTEQDWAKGAEFGGWADTVLKELSDADLRGLGGAGIPASQKWKDVRDAIRKARSRDDDDRGFIVVNGDESEPGTFKDRELLLRSPHVVVEGVILAGLLSEATQGFIYIRHEYHEQIEACRAEIKRAEELGFCGDDPSQLGRPFKVSVFASPGGYICGEQSALIEAMSDRRGEPRNMPPKLETNGLANLPTLVSNVETFAWAPSIILNSGAAYAARGVNGWKGRRWFSISGDVKRPGVYEVPMGMTLRELIYGEQYCQGMIGDRKLKGFAPSGPSGGFLPAKLSASNGLPRKYTENAVWQGIASRHGFDPQATELDILDLELELNAFRALSPTQALGAGLVVYAEGRDMVEQAFNSLSFYRNESCGKCVPCRIGSQKLASLGSQLLEGKIAADKWQKELIPLIGELGRAIELSSICGLGRSVPVPLKTVVEYFGADLQKHLSGSPALQEATV